MTVDHIHDALTLLPSDLIAEVDKKRRSAPKIIIWRRIATMAACFALVVGCSWYAMTLFSGGVTEQAAAEAPMMQGTPSLSDKAAVEEAAPMEEAAPEAEEEGICGVPTVPRQENSTNAAGTPKEDNLSIDHTHRPAEPAEEDKNAVGWCGNLTAAISLDGVTYSLSGTDAVTLTDILYQLDYAPENLCRCPAEFTADTEMGVGYAISLTNYFVRFEDRQAGLTEVQAETIRQILAGLK